MCKGRLENSLSTFMTDLGSCIIIVKNVPPQVCRQCGEVSYANDVTRQLEQIVTSIKKTVHTEIAVVNYVDQAV
jgi:YgiT-type zinc finger domain-containing protein